MERGEVTETEATGENLRLQNVLLCSQQISGFSLRDIVLYWSTKVAVISAQVVLL